MQVKKQDGTLEPFDREKVVRALVRSGAGSATASEIATAVESKLKNGMSTSRIYTIAFKSLEESKPGAAYRFSLKNSLMEMGPEGYAFETYLAEIIKAHGHDTKTRQILRGRCVTHETDVVAEMGGKTEVFECKYHNLSDGKCRIQNALYTYARFLDLKDAGSCDHATLATNTKFTEEVIMYSNCVGLGLLGWSYSTSGGSLQDLIEAKRIYPINMLSAINRFAFSRLHSAGIITLKQVGALSDSELEKLGINSQVIGKIRAQSGEIEKK